MAILVAILNFSKCSSIWACYTADMLQVTPKEMKTNEKKTLQSVQGIPFWLPDYKPISSVPLLSIFSALLIHALAIEYIFDSGDTCQI